MPIKKIFVLLGSVALAVDVTFVWGGDDRPTKFSNRDSVVNTRHNMTQNPIGGGATLMNPSRNDYGEVCVYCHTPHGANGAVQLPLWNHTIKPTTYTTYSAMNSAGITQPITQPGANSLACLSCHDGQTAIDSIINMPGSGRYNPAQATTQNDAFLDTWPSIDAVDHSGLNSGGAACMVCHVPGTFKNATDFTAFLIGTDLRNDHPVGIRYPTTGPNVADFKPTTGTRGDLKFFDTNGNGRPDKNEVRLYDTGDGYEVECASCHDPHGVPSGAPGSQFIPTFLRVSNAGSALCLICHTK